MRSLLTEQFGITDRRTLDALTDKADRVTDFYARQDTKLLAADRTFSMDDFPPDKITEHKYTGASGMEYTTKQKPLDSVENSIQRTGKDLFTVDTTFRSTEITDKGESLPHEKTEHLEFSLADKKRTLHFLSAMYLEAGMSEADAKSMAKEVYSKAEAQSPEKVLRIEEVRQNSMTVAYGKASVMLSTADRQEAAERDSRAWHPEPVTACSCLHRSQHGTAGCIAHISLNPRSTSCRSTHSANRNLCSQVPRSFQWRG